MSAPVSSVRSGVHIGHGRAINRSAMGVGTKPIVIECATSQSRSASGSVRAASGGRCRLAPETRYGQISHTAASKAGLA